VISVAFSPYLSHSLFLGFGLSLCHIAYFVYGLLKKGPMAILFSLHKHLVNDPVKKGPMAICYYHHLVNGSLKKCPMAR
jgi:hypothetical protein